MYSTIILIVVHGHKIGLKNSEMEEYPAKKKTHEKKDTHTHKSRKMSRPAPVTRVRFTHAVMPRAEGRGAFFGAILRGLQSVGEERGAMFTRKHKSQRKRHKRKAQGTYIAHTVRSTRVKYQAQRTKGKIQSTEHTQCKAHRQSTKR